jgi:hypothetical protein
LVNVGPLEIIDWLIRADVEQRQQVVEGVGIGTLVAACLPFTKEGFLKSAAENYVKSLDADGIRALWRALPRDQQDRVIAIANAEMDAEAANVAPAR